MVVMVGGVAGGWFSWSGGGVTHFIWWWNSPHSFQRSEDNLSYSLKLQDIFLDLLVAVVVVGGGALAYINVVGGTYICINIDYMVLYTDLGSQEVFGHLMSLLLFTGND